MKRLAQAIVIATMVVSLLFGATVFAVVEGPLVEESGTRSFTEVVVPAVWIPIDRDTHAVLGYLGVRPTNPEMYPRSEVAELVDEEFYISYKGIPRPTPTSWSESNFLSTGNVMFRDKYHRVVANGIAAGNLSSYGLTQSSVLKVEYGDFEDSDYVNGLHGMTKTPYQEGETLKLYLATVESSLSYITTSNNTLIAEKGDTEILQSLYTLVEEVGYLPYTFVEFDWGQYPPGRIFTGEEFGDWVETIWVYDEEAGSFIEESGAYRNFSGGEIDGLAAGEYTVVFPFYYEMPIMDYLSAPDVFSRDRYTISDSVYLKLVIEEPEPEPTEPEPTETEPRPTETGPTETQPVETQPTETQPIETEPEVTEPEITEPIETEPEVTKPKPDYPTTGENSLYRFAAGSLLFAAVVVVLILLQKERMEHR